MTDLDYIESISRMTMPELLREIIDHPSYLTDVYYSDFARAIGSRAEELLDEKP